MSLWLRIVETGTELEHIDNVPDSIWRRIREQPERAPELIAVAAAERFADPAEAWVRRADPTTSPRSLAKTVYKQHVRLARAGGFALGFGGVLTGAANLGGLAWIQARMVFYIAAALGHDPRDPMRPAELLALWEIYESPAEARAALDGLGKSMAQAMLEREMSGRDERHLSGRLMRYAGKRMVKRGAGRLLPVLGAPISALQNGGSTRALGRRARAFYEGSGPTGSKP